MTKDATESIEGRRRQARWRLAILLTVLAITVGSDVCRGGDRRISPRVLRWGADAEGGAPYIFKDPNNPNRNIGFEVDIAHALERELGCLIAFTQYEFTSLFDGLRRGDIDLAMNGLEITPERLAEFRLSKPYYAYKLQLVVRPDEERFTTLEGLRQIKGVVGTLENTAAWRLLQQRHIRRRGYSGQVEPYKDLAQRQLDGVLLDLPIALYYAKTSLVMPEDPNLKFTGQLIGRGYYAIAFNKKNESLAEEVDAALDRLWARGELRRIYQKWHIWNDNQEEFLPQGVFHETDERQTDDDPVEAGGFVRLLLEGAWMTVQITFCGFALAVLIALPVALARLYGPTPLRWLAISYVEFFRGIPVLLLLVFLYYGLPEIADAYDLSVSLKMNPFAAAVLGFGLNYAAYEAEIYRTGIGAIPAGQWEAAGSLGMSPALTFRRIILPQAVRLILPPMTNDFVALFKDTSVVSVVAVVELTKQYLILTKSSSQHLIEIALTTAALYLIMSVPLGYVSRYLERRWALHG